MGVFNPNGHMPTNCYDCYEEKEADCDINKGVDSASNYKDSRYPKCPLTEIDLVRCGECKHKPIKYDPEGDDFGFNLVSPNGYDNLCPCLNTDDGFYSYMPEDNFFCAYGERRSDENSDMDNSDNRTD